MYIVTNSGIFDKTIAIFFVYQPERKGIIFSNKI